MQELFRIISGVISAGILFWYAWQIYSGKSEPPNPASWILWWLIDTIVLITTYISGKPIGLPLGWSLGAGLVVFTIFKKGSWMWSYKETICTISTGLAVYFWLSLGAAAGVIAGAIAIFISGIPIFIDMIRTPYRKTLPVWAFTALACVFTLLGSDGTLVGTIVGWESLVNNIVMSLVVLRDKR